MSIGLTGSFKRGVRQLVSRRIYIVAMVAIPIGMALFFLSLLDSGLPTQVPTAIVDLDNSAMSRQMTRSLSALETVNITQKPTSVDEAMEMVNRGEIYGFFLIPDNFEKDALSQRSPTLSYYTNLTYYIPGTLAFKGFKTLAVSTSGSIVMTKLVSAGVNEEKAGTLLQPIVVQDHPIHNPWTNYSIYLSNSFIPGIIALMVLLVTAFSICSEIKNNTARQWLDTAHRSILTALLGKLAPQTAIFTIVGVFCQSLLWRYSDFPLHCSPLTMIAAMALLVIATQAFAVVFCCLLPNLRLAVSAVSLIGILSFSITGFSFPIESMYGSVGIFSYIVPLRYYFLIYIDQALNGVALYYSRWYFIALILFPFIPSALAWKLKRAL